MEYKFEIEKLMRVMESFSRTADVPVTFFDKDMNIMWECLEEKKFCTVFTRYENYNSECKVSLQRAVMTATNIGEPYVFMCASELIGIMYPLINEEQLEGTIMVGPVVVSKNKDSALKKMFKTMPDFRGYANEVLNLVDLNGVKSTADMSHMYEVFCNCIFSHRLLKDSFATDSHLVGNIAMAIKSNDQKNAIMNLELLCERAYITNSGNVNQIKYYILSCVDDILETLNIKDLVYEKDAQRLDVFKDAISTEEIFAHAKQIVLYMMSNWNRVSSYSGNSQIINDAIAYLFANYKNDIELTELAKEVHVNASYLSVLFKRETGLTFSQCLNGIRVEKSLELLKNTNLTLEEISAECGFSSQSYYIKTFKNNYNISPGKYRAKYLTK